MSEIIGEQQEEREEQIPKTPRESIRIYKERIAERGFYSDETEPHNNEVFEMKADVKTIINALIASGKFELDLDRGEENRLTDVAHNIGIQIANWIVHDSKNNYALNLKTATGKDSIHSEDVIKRVKEGWVYSTLHIGSHETPARPNENYLYALEDLLDVAEANKIPMATTHRIKREDKSPGYYHVEYDPSKEE